MPCQCLIKEHRPCTVCWIQLLLDRIISVIVQSDPLRLYHEHYCLYLTKSRVYVLRFPAVVFMFTTTALLVALSYSLSEPNINYVLRLYYVMCSTVSSFYPVPHRDKSVPILKLASYSDHKGHSLSNLHRKYKIPVCDVTGNHGNRDVTQSFALFLIHKEMLCKEDKINNKIQLQNITCLPVAEIAIFTYLLVNSC
jgi:hypothetical protein